MSIPNLSRPCHVCQDPVCQDYFKVVRTMPFFKTMSCLSCLCFSRPIWSSLISCDPTWYTFDPTYYLLLTCKKNIFNMFFYNMFFQNKNFVVWSSLIWFYQVWSSLIKFNQVWSNVFSTCFVNLFCQIFLQTWKSNNNNSNKKDMYRTALHAPVVKNMLGTLCFFDFKGN
jgi:hypothetical protein